jgi:hypothetical protein
LAVLHEAPDSSARWLNPPVSATVTLNAPKPSPLGTE